jgi:hypothetical protein
MKIGLIRQRISIEYFFFDYIFSKNWVVDPSQPFYYYWSSVVSLAVLYNYIMLIGRSAFLLLQERLLIVWLVFDYVCDVCYIADTFIQTRKGLTSRIAFFLF